MKPVRLVGLIVALVMLPPLGSEAVAVSPTPDPDSAEARILVERADDGEELLLRATFLAERRFDETLRYRFTVVERGAAGRSSTRQAGTFEAPVGERVVLSTVGLDGSGVDSVEAVLVVRADGRTLDRHRVERRPHDLLGAPPAPDLRVSRSRNSSVARTRCSVRSPLTHRSPDRRPVR